MYRIILVDDEPLILAGIASLIQWESLGCTLVGKATNGPNALELIRETQPDIVITDIRMPVMDGLELIGRCREEGMEFSFIVLTNLEEFHLARQAVRLGAVDYLVKLDLSPDSLISALKRAKEECGLRESHRNRELYDLLIKDNAKQLDTDYFKHLLLPRKAGLPHCRQPAKETLRGENNETYQPCPVSLTYKPYKSTAMADTFPMAL